MSMLALYLRCIAEFPVLMRPYIPVYSCPWIPCPHPPPLHYNIPKYFSVLFFFFFNIPLHVITGGGDQGIAAAPSQAATKKAALTTPAPKVPEVPAANPLDNVVIKPASDIRTYRVITLKNGLRVGQLNYPPYSLLLSI